MRKLMLLVPMFTLVMCLPAFAAPKNGMQIIPEPGSLATLGVAVAGMAFYLKKRKH